MIGSSKKAGVLGGLLLSLCFSALFVIVATSDLWLLQSISKNTPLPYTIRLPSMGFFSDTLTGGAEIHYESVKFPRGKTLTNEQLRILQAYKNQRRPAPSAFMVGLCLLFFLVFFFFTRYLRNAPMLAARFRTHFALLLSLFLFAMGAKACLMLTSLSAAWLPLASLIIPVGVLIGRRAAAATAITGALTLSLLTPLDLPLFAIMLAQGLAASAVDMTKQRNITKAVLSAVFAGGLAYFSTSLLFATWKMPQISLLHPKFLLSSDMVASFGGGLISGFCALLVQPVLSRMVGLVSKNELVALTDFETPLLKMLAARAPGTWAHSLAMANMAEIAANAIGANALLVRVGAYYHDIGKMTSPEYFIENQAGNNPHDALRPEVSADAIFTHVTDGVTLARKHGLPQAVTEFIYTHHGNGLLEYFWHKYQTNGNPKVLTESDFCYPGCPPPTRETAILSLCDAVEAASRTVADASPEKFQDLVRRIVLGKLERGLLSDSGLTLPELKRIMISMIDTLRSSHHGRVKYPWQKDENNNSQTPTPIAEAPSNQSQSGARLVQPANASSESRQESAASTLPLEQKRSS